MSLISTFARRFLGGSRPIAAPAIGAIAGLSAPEWTSIDLDPEFGRSGASADLSEARPDAALGSDSKTDPEPDINLDAEAAADSLCFELIAEDDLLVAKSRSPAALAPAAGPALQAAASFVDDGDAAVAVTPASKAPESLAHGVTQVRTAAPKKRTSAASTKGKSKAGATVSKPKGASRARSRLPGLHMGDWKFPGVDDIAGFATAHFVESLDLEVACALDGPKQ